MVVGNGVSERRIAAAEFFRGLYETALAPGELLLAVEIPFAADRRTAFMELARRHGDYAIVGIAFVAAAITPTVDPVNMALVMAPLLGLYFLGVIMARAVYRPRTISST